MRKILSLVLCIMLVLGVMAPAMASETVNLKLWGSQDDQVMLQGMVDSFKAAHPDMNVEVTLGVVGEPDAQARYSEDPAAAADVFAFPDDQLYNLVRAGALYEITLNKDAIIAANSEGSVKACTIDDAMYAYPMTADNGYFLYYDKSVISEEDAKSLDSLLAAANKAGKKVFMDVSNGWYIASFFLGAGCTLFFDENGNQLCDFNNEKGLAAAEAIQAFTADPAFMTGEPNTDLPGGIGDTIAAGVCGTWVSAPIKEALGDNYAATKLPTFTLNGEQVQMSSFAGFKLVGVNFLTAHPLEAMALAEWITNEENQLVRFQVREIGPSNLNVAASEEVKANIHLAALALQNQFGSAQQGVSNNYWTPAEAFGAAMENKDYSIPLQDMLDTLVAQATAE